MRQLHVIAVSDDGSDVLLATTRDATRPSHRVPIDDRLRAAIRGALPPAGHGGVESALSPKEIQARLRAGATPEQVAKAAGVPVSRILRYAGPVLSERDRVVEEAQAAYVSKPRRGISSIALGQAVETHLVTTSALERDSVEWSARRAEDGSWIVTLAFAARGRRTASWRWRPHEHTVHPLDALAGRIGYADEPAAAPVRRRRAPRKAVVTKPAKRAKPAAKPAAKKAAPAEKKAAPAKQARKATGRAAVPSWSDVLLGGPRAPQPARNGGTTRRRARST